MYVFYAPVHCGISWTGLDALEGQCLGQISPVFIDEACTIVQQEFLSSVKW